jgi:hypothetical protein
LNWLGKGRNAGGGKNEVWLLNRRGGVGDYERPSGKRWLIGNGTNTVSVNFWFPSSTVPPPACDDTTNPNCENEKDSTQNTAPTIPAFFPQGVADGATISVGDTQIVITNLIPETFCSDGKSAGAACKDPFTGFEFLFSSGVDITGVSVDSSSNFSSE